MIFEIKVANTTTGTGPVHLQLNGMASVRASRVNGSDLVGNDLTASENYLFMYNGVDYTSTIQATAAQKSSNIISATTFYVRTDSTSVVNSSGIESNDGLANTPTEAFKTVQGAVNTIKATYISMDTITIRVADGTYTGGAFVGNSYIAAWNIVGNSANPGNCIIDATSTNSAVYVPGSNAGTCFEIDNSGVMDITGFYLRSYYANATCVGGCTMYATNIYYTSPIRGSPTCGASSGSTYGLLGTNNQFIGTTSCDCFLSAYGGTVAMGGHDVYGTSYMTATVIGNPPINRGFAESIAGGHIIIFDSVCSFPGGQPQGPAYFCSQGGGIDFMDGNSNVFPGSQPGQVYPPGWIS
jgi:hypothetical protein